MKTTQIRTKKGGGGMKKTSGGGCFQNEMLQRFEDDLGLTAIGAANVLKVKYNTYKEWKGCRRKMTTYTCHLVEVMTAIKGTKIGKRFGV